MALVMAAFILPASAATIFWDGSGTSWNAVGSWSTVYTATTPDPAAVPGVADTALFNISTVNSAQTVYLGGNQSASALTFSNTSTTTLLGGSSGSPAANTLTLGTNGAALTIASVTANAGVVTIGDASGGGANVTPILAGPTNNIITVASGRTLNLANGLNFNTGKIQNNGAGTLVLNAAGSGSGLLTTVGTVNYNIIARLDSGTVTLGNAAAFGTGVVDTRNYTLQCNTDLSGANKILNTFVLATGTTIIGGSTNLELGGQFIAQASGGLTINNTAATTLSGPLYLSDVSGTGHTLTISGAAGPTTISGAISNYTAGAGTAGALTKTGGGTLIISSANNTYSGTTTIGASGGAAVIRAAATQALGTGTISFDGTGNASTARLEVTNGISLSNNITFYARGNTTVGIENLSGNNTLSGTITCSSGGNFYTIQSDAGLLTLGTAGAIAINASSGTRTNTLQGAGNGSIVGNITNGPGAVEITKAGAGTWTLSGSNTYTLGTIISAGTLVMASTNALGTNGMAFTGTANATLDLATDGSDYTNVVNAGSGTVFTIASDVKTGSVGINHNLGTFLIGSGSPALQLNVTAGPNVASGSPQITAPLILSGGLGGTTIINPTTAKMTFSSVTAINGNKTLQLDGTNTGNSVTGTITDGSGSVITLLKTNTGTWTLGGANTYTGTTTIGQGTLILGSGGAINGSSTITVAAGATFDVSASSYSLGASQTLSGSGTVAGNFSDSTGSQITPGGAGAVETLTFNNNLNLAAGDTNKFDFNSTTNDLIVVNGNLTNNAGSVINLGSLPAGGLANGTYTLMQVSGALGGSAGNFTITGKPSPSRQSFSIVYDNVSSPKRVLLQVTGSSAALVWLGTSSPWDIVTSQNWTNAAAVSKDYYFDGDNVSFTDLGSAISPVLNTNVQPGSVTFNSANSYTLTGTGAINGSAGLTKTNSGTLTIQTTNNYTGVTAFNGGIVSIATITNSGSASPIGAASSASANLAFNGGTLQYTGGNGGTDHGATLNAGGGTVQVTSSATTLLLSSPIVGSSGGGLTSSGSGTLVLSGANTYNGNTTISGGILQVGNGGATGNLGTGSTITDNSALVVLRTGTLVLTNNIGGPGNITNNGTGTLTLSGVNTFTGGLTVNTGIVQVASVQGIGGTPAAFNPSQININVGELEAATTFSISDTNSGVTVAAGTIGVDSGMTLTISNEVVSTTSLTKALPGTLILSGSNTLSGVLNVDTSTTTASDGALRIASTNALGGVPTIQIRANQGPGSSTLQLDGTAGSINVNPASFNWSGRNNFVAAIENIAGDNIWNPSTVTFNVGGSYYMFQSDAGSLTLAGTFPTTAPTAGRNVSFAGTGNISITGTFQSGGCTNISLFKTNSGTLTLWSANSYSGLTSVQGGTMNAADGSSFGTSTANIELAPYTGETAVLNISIATVTAQRVIVAGVTANNTTPGTGTVNQVNGTVSASQWVTVGSGGTSGGVGTYNLSGSGTLNVQNTAGGTQLEVANFTGSSGTLNISGSSILNIENNAYISLGANASACNGTVNQTGGTVTFYSDAGSTVGGTGILYLGKATGLTSNYIYNLAGGTLQVPTVTSASGNSQFYFNGGTLKAAKTNTAFMSGLTAANVSTGGAIIDDGGFAVTIAQALIHDPALGGADGGLTKQDTGLLILNGNNTYTGPTTNNGGTLLINGSNGAGSTTVAGGTVGGGGTLAGAVDVQSGGTLAPGAAIGILTINNSVAFESGSTAQFNFGTGTNSRVVVTGAVNMNGATTVAINYISSIAAVGVYPLIQYGSLTGFGNLTTPTSPNPRFTFSLTNDTTAKVISLVVSGNPASLTWHGDGSGNYWDNTGNYQNWIRSGNPDYFYDGDSALFDNTGSNTPSIYLTATVSPASVTVNSTNDYDFAGSSSIAGPGGLTKSGTGRLTLEVNNTYIGTTVINNGTVQVGAGSTSGSLGTGNVTNNGALAFDRSDAIVLPSPIYGIGSVTMALGNVTASGSNYYTGATFINSGIVYLANSAGLGATNGTITVASGAQLYSTASVNVGANPLSFSGTGDGNGAWRAGGSTTNTYNGAVTLTGNTTFAADGGATLNHASPSGLNGAAANASLTLGANSLNGAGVFSGPLALGSGGLTVASGVWTLGPSNNFTGLTTINAGTLGIVDATLGNPPSFTANQITFAGGSLEVISNATFNDGKAGITLNAAATWTVNAGATLTVFNDISGSSTLTKAGAGMLVLNGSYSFSGVLNLDTGSNTANDGATRIASPNALVNVPVTPGTPTIFENANNSGSSVLQFDGSAGNLNLQQEGRYAFRNNATVNIENLSGSNTISGNVDTFSGGNAIYFQSDSGTLNISGNIQYIGTLNGARTYFFTGAGDHVVNGVITAGVNTNAPINVAMNGTGTLILAGANTYTNTTTVNSGLMLVNGSILGGGGVTVNGTATLGGGGTIIGTVTVQPGGTLAPGPTLDAYPTEMLSLDLSGGTLPPGVIIRESPLKASLGQTRILPAPGGGYTISSYFDVFVELSIDGGTTWWPDTNAPCHMMLGGPNPTNWWASNVLPPPDGYYTNFPPTWVGRFGNGMIISNIVHRDFSTNFPPPPKGSSDTHGFNSRVTMMVWTGFGWSSNSASGPVSVHIAGQPGIGMMSINGVLTLQSGSATVADVNATTGTNDVVVGLTSVTYGGTLLVANEGRDLALHDNFKLFDSASFAGNFASILPEKPGAGLAWSFNPTNGVLSVVLGIASNPTNITATVSGDMLTLSWPADHLGWILQAQTNGLGTGFYTNWVDVAGSAANNTSVIIISPANPTVFYRLRYPN
jgi:autotransporter-associated beta strand protein